MKHARLALALALAPVPSCTPVGPAEGPQPDAAIVASPDLAVDLAAPADLRPVPGWSRRLGEGGFSEINGVAIDSKGNVLAAAEIDQLSPMGTFATRASLIKLSPQGEIRWERRLSESFSSMTAVAVDSAGNVLCGGYFGSPTVDLGTGPISKKGMGGSFLASYGPEGNLRWVRPVIAAQSSQVWRITIGPDDGPRVAITYSGAMDLGQGPLRDSGGSALASYGQGGDLLWARSLGPKVMLRSVAMGPGGTVVFGGYFWETLDLGVVQLKSTGGYDGLVGRTDADGAPRWARALGGPNDDAVSDVAVDGTALAVAGSFQGTLDLGKGPLTSAGGSDVFVTRLDDKGMAEWSRSFGGAASDQAHAVATDGRAILVVGRVEGDVDLGTGVLMGAGQSDAFLLALSSAGKPLLARRYGSPGLEAAYAVTSNGINQVIGGFFQGAVDFGYGPLRTMGNTNTVDAFLTQLALPY